MSDMRGYMMIWCLCLLIPPSLILGGVTKSPVRLVNGSNINEGRVEIYHAGRWGSICDDNFGTEEAKVVCRSLGFESYHAVSFQSAYFGSSTGPIWLDDVNCGGHETFLDQCSSNDWGTNNCQHSEDVGVSCPVPIRLVNGRGHITQGRVEIQINGTWGTICDDRFDEDDAKVICSMLGFSRTRARAVTSAGFGEGSGSIYLDELRCTGTEASIMQCPANSVGQHDCSHSEDAGVRCQMVPIRLVNGRGHRRQGRVEIQINGTWGTICDDNFDDDDAKVICSMLGFSRTAARAVTSARFGEGSGLIYLDELRCTGTEASIMQCPANSVGQHDCSHSEDAGVQCQMFPIRLVNGGGYGKEGRVEIQINGTWGTICDDSFDDDDAKVICSMLGFNRTGARAVTSAGFGEGSELIYLDELRCTGTEASIMQCPANSVGQHDCSHSEDAGVRCQMGGVTKSPVRLVNGSNINEGRVEIYHAGRWGSICDDNFGTDEAKVVCRSLGFESHLAVSYQSAYFGSSTGPIWLDDVDCGGYETYLDLCPSNDWGTNNCQHSEDVGVSCPVAIRLVNARGHGSEGRVEIQINGTWGTICDDSFDDDDAKVICSMLGFNRTGALAVTTAGYGQGSGSIFLDELRCTGTEASIMQCPANSVGQHDCSHSEDAGVRCQMGGLTKSPVRLVNGSNINEGRVEIYHAGRWGSICDDNFGTEEAKVVCRSLGFESHLAVSYQSAYFGSSTGQIWLDDVDCGGYEPYLDQCLFNDWGTNNCQHSEDVGVSCPVAIRLVNARGHGSEGRVEIQINGTWGTICDDSFDDDDAEVICSMLGFNRTAAWAVTNAGFGEGSGSIFLDELRCTGTEASIMQCPANSVGQHDCSHSEDAGVRCPMETWLNMRLVNGNVSTQGRIEIEINGAWGTICDDLFDDEDAGVICVMLGFSRSGAQAVTGAGFGEGSGPIYLDNLACTGIETSILQCPGNPLGVHNCQHSEDTGVHCQKVTTANVRLVNGGENATEGRVEIRINGTWGTVCDDMFDSKDAGVICGMLGFSRTAAQAVTDAGFGRGSGFIYLDDLACTGTEPSILQCPANPVGQHNCGHSEDAGVRCHIRTPMRLVNGNNSYEGRVEIFYDGRWGSICDDDFDTQAAQVVCRSLGFQSDQAMSFQSAYFGSSTGPIWLDDVNCGGHETFLDQCSSNDWGTNNCMHSEDVGISCQYFTNSVTFNPPSPSHVEEGESLSVRCTAVCNPACSYSWSLGSVQLSSYYRLLLTNISRNQSGQLYTCTVHNTATSNYTTGQFHLTVYYGPDSVTFNPPSPSHVKEGEGVNMSCTAVCNPACSYSWSLGSVQLSSSSQLLLTNISRNQSGQLYTCTVHNTATSNYTTRQFHLTVYYGPDSVTFNPPSPSHVKEGEGVNMSCTAVCNPACSYSWSLGSVQLSSSYQLLLTDISRSQSGQLYTCTVHNTATSNYTTGQFHLTVYYGPDPITFNPASPGNAMEGEIIRVLCNTVCIPSCSYSWSVDNQEISTSSLLSLKDIHRNQTGDVYECTVHNNATSSTSSRQFQLKVLCPPSIPSNVTTWSSGPSSVSVAWIEEFNCRLPQTFLIRYRADDTVQWNNLSEVFAERGLHTKHTAVIANLNPNTKYIVQVLAYNEDGFNGFTPMQTVFTKEDISETHPPVGVILGSVLAIAVVGLTLMGVAIYCRRKKAKSRQDHTHDSSQSNDRIHESAFYDNQAYMHGGRTESSGNESSTYWSLGTRDDPAYEMIRVLKTVNQNDGREDFAKESRMKSKPETTQQTRQETTYENIHIYENFPLGNDC